MCVFSILCVCNASRAQANLFQPATASCVTGTLYVSAYNLDGPLSLTGGDAEVTSYYDPDSGIHVKKADCSWGGFSGTVSGAWALSFSSSISVIGTGSVGYIQITIGSTTLPNIYYDDIPTNGIVTEPVPNGTDLSTITIRAFSDSGNVPDGSVTVEIGPITVTPSAGGGCS